jgi:hypothetical protein
VYFGYCHRQRRYRMMHLQDYVANVQDGISRMTSDATTAYGDVMRSYVPPTGGRAPGDARCHDRCAEQGCGCECCVCDADVLVHARCGEVRRIPLTLENDTRRERQVTLELDRFVTAGGRDLRWKAELSETQFVLRGCDEKTVVVRVEIECLDADANDAQRKGALDRCEVGYTHVRGSGCLIRPIVLAVAVLPEHCDSYRHGCQCGCCS